MTSRSVRASMIAASGVAALALALVGCSAGTEKKAADQAPAAPQSPTAAPSSPQAGTGPQAVADDVNTYLKAKVNEAKTVEDVNNLSCAEYGISAKAARKVDDLLKASGKADTLSLGGNISENSGVKPENIVMKDDDNADVKGQDGTTRSMRRERGHWLFCDPAMKIEELAKELTGLPTLPE